MEYVHGAPLSVLVAATRARGERIPPAIVSAIVCGMLHGLHAAHEAKNPRGEPLGIIHRDVSPQNVLVGVDGIARVLDFGVAKASGDVQTTQEGQIKGKIAYMPPEQLQGEPVDRRADVYAAAVVLWEALTCERLFGGDELRSAIQSVLVLNVDPPSRRVPGLPASLDAIVLRGLARTREERYATAQEMALALQACVPPAPPPELGQWVEARGLDVIVSRVERIARFDEETMSSEDMERLVSSVCRKPPAATVRRVTVADPSASQISSISVSTPQTPVTAEARGTRWWRTSGAVLTTVALGVAGAWVVARPMRAPAASPGSSEIAAPLPASAAILAEPPTPPAPSQGSEKTPPPPVRPAVRKAALNSTSASPVPKANACETRDSSGHVVFDIECLRHQPHAAP
jgi:serine/threonine protein kinase